MALTVQLEKPLGEGEAAIEMYNGEFLGTANPRRVSWSQDQPLVLKVRYSKLRPWLSDRRCCGSGFPGPPSAWRWTTC